jgi:hypothetical protein
MSGLVRWFKHEIKALVPAVAFFFLALNVIRATEDLMLEECGVQYIGFGDTVILALVLGKVILTVELLRFANIPSRGPLIFVTLWKTALGSLGAIVFRVGERLVRFVAKHQNLVDAFDQIGATDWPRFWAIQIWITALLLIFVAFREVVMAAGMPRVGHMFFASTPRKTETE